MQREKQAQACLASASFLKLNSDLLEEHNDLSARLFKLSVPCLDRIGRGRPVAIRDQSLDIWNEVSGDEFPFLMSHRRGGFNGGAPSITVDLSSSSAIFEVAIEMLRQQKDLVE